MTSRWSFYGRGAELGALLEHMRRPGWFFGTIRGRRRIGKTALIQQALETLAADAPDCGPWLLVEVPDSVPADFATVFRGAVEAAGLRREVGALRPIAGLAGVADAVGSLCRGGVTVVLDEFQVCRRGPLKGFPSLLKTHIDRLQNMNPVGGMILLGSVQTEMEALLDDRQAPLFGRKTFDLSLGPWLPSTMLEVADRHGAREPSRLLTLSTLFGGVPKYWRDYGEAGLAGIPAWSDWAAEVCRRLFLRVDSPLRDEGESLLGRELRRNYLAVVRAVARLGPCAHADIGTALPGGGSLGPYLRTLVHDLHLLEKRLPVFATDRQKRARYVVADPFLLAWLRVFHPARQAARVQPARKVAKGILSRLATLEGHAFERFVAAAMEEASRTGRGFAVTDRVRGYWNRARGAEGPIELDLVAWNEDAGIVRFGSCKRRAAKHDGRSLKRFRTQVDRFMESAGRRFAGWKRELVLFSPQFAEAERERLEDGDWLCRDMEDMRRLLAHPDRGARGASSTSPKILGTD